MGDELLERRETLRSLDRRLSSVSADIEHIIDSNNEFRSRPGSVSVHFNAGTQADEGQVREELIEIAASLRTLTSRAVPEVDDAAGWGPTMQYRVPELRKQAAHMQELVREAFAELEAQLPDNVPSEPLDDLTPHEGEVPGDNRARRLKLLQAVFGVSVITFIVWSGFIDMGAARLACAHPSACASDDPQISVYGSGWLVVQQRGTDCEEQLRLHFDRDGELLRQVERGDGKPDSWPSEDLRGRASCSEVESLRWTWVMRSKR
jgi:hypothetical protein